MTDHKTGRREEWSGPGWSCRGREALTRRSDELARRRQELPWVRVEKATGSRPKTVMRRCATCSAGVRSCSLSRSCSIRTGTKAAPSCSAGHDGFAGSVPHFEHHDVAFVVVSRARSASSSRTSGGWDGTPLGLLVRQQFQLRFHVTADPAVAPVEYNYKDQAQLEAENAAWRGWSGEQPGMSAFARNGGDVVPHVLRVFRGFDGLWPMWQWLDRAPLGRNRRRHVMVSPARRVPRDRRGTVVIPAHTARTPAEEWSMCHSPDDRLVFVNSI